MGAKRGKRSMKKEKNRNSVTKERDPGNPKKRRTLIRDRRNNLGHKRFNPVNSVIKRVLNRLLMASTKKKAIVERRAWLTSIKRPARKRGDSPEKIAIANQCISITVA